MAKKSNETKKKKSPYISIYVGGEKSKEREAYNKFCAEVKRVNKLHNPKTLTKLFWQKFGDGIIKISDLY